MNIIYNTLIELYIKKFIPKYISSFCNSHINGEVIIGVNDDDHEISGIPFLTLSKYNLNTYKIKSIIKEQFVNLRCINVNDKEILDAIDVELVEINYLYKLSVDYLKDEDKEIREQIQNYYKQIEEYNNLLEKYIKDKRENWRTYFDKYHIGLQTFIDNYELRLELCEYISKFNIDGKYNHIIEYLKNEKKIIVPTGNIVKILKHNDNNLLYWLTIYRDFKKDEILSQKPKKPILNLQNCIYPDILFKRISLLKRLISQNVKNQNNGLKYFMIKIKINGKKFKQPKYKNMEVMYKDILKIKKKISWITGYRCIINNDPYCANY